MKEENLVGRYVKCIKPHCEIFTSGNYYILNYKGVPRNNNDEWHGCKYDYSQTTFELMPLNWTPENQNVELNWLIYI